MTRRREFFQINRWARKFVWHPNGKYEVLSEICKSPLPWVGGKNYLAKWIISHFPEHLCYVEPFGGGASILLQKKPSKVEVWNDIDGGVVEFFEVLRDKPWALATLLAFIPYSRWIYEEWKNMAKAGSRPKNKIERVAMWFYLQKSAFGGKPSGGWGHRKTQSVNFTFEKIFPSLLMVHNRLQSVYIENKDFREVITTYDSPETLFYCDPPYFETPTSYYVYSFTLRDHEDLANILHKVKGKVCLSYGPHSKVDELYPDWRRTSKETPVHSFPITKHTKSKKRPRRVELLLMNY